MPSSPEDLCLTFSYELGCVRYVVDLLPDGQHVEVRDLFDMFAQAMCLRPGCVAAGAAMPTEDRLSVAALLLCSSSQRAAQHQCTAHSLPEG